MGKNDDVKKNVHAFVKAIGENNIKEIERLYNIDNRLIGGGMLGIAVRVETFVKPETLNKLVILGADHEYLDFKGNTCLTDALLVGHPEYIECLLKSYANVCIHCRDMSKEDTFKAIKNLVNKQNKNGETMLNYFGNTKKDIEVKNMLIENGYLEERKIQNEHISPKQNHVEKYKQEKSEKKSSGCSIM